MHCQFMSLDQCVDFVDEFECDVFHRPDLRHRDQSSEHIRFRKETCLQLRSLRRSGFSILDEHPEYDTLS